MPRECGLAATRTSPMGAGPIGRPRAVGRLDEPQGEERGSTALDASDGVGEALAVRCVEPSEATRRRAADLAVFLHGVARRQGVFSEGEE